MCFSLILYLLVVEGWTGQPPSGPCAPLGYPLQATVVLAAWRTSRAILIFPDGLDYALLAYGMLPNQTEVASDADAAVDAFTTNATSVIALLTHLAGLFEKQGQGAIAVISSVAGDRGRPSNYVYGAAKGAISLFAQGLRARLAKHGVSVTTIKPGFVDTPMTADVPKNRLFADPADVGARIHKAMKKGQDVVYIPAFWRGVMGVIKAIPERVFKKLDL
ncbi:MAG: SDR family NAD(P)-dependent oxidoreductase [Bacteroidetes bacterium]|nr:SDR family NAD(P)-dependent oxidoreductase [Bacteroidota bacterium]